MLDLSTLRTTMVDTQLRPQSVTSLSVLAAFSSTPREFFVPATQQKLAYLDRDIAFDEGRLLSAAAPLAKLVQLADVTKEDHVLIVGSGGGYSAAIFAQLAKSIVALESSPSLAEFSKAALQKAGVQNVDVVQGALQDGCKAKAPYDVIFFEGAIDDVPQALTQQLKESGKIIAVIGRGRTAKATIFLKVGPTTSGRVAFDCALPLLPGFQKEEGFAFAV